MSILPDGVPFTQVPRFLLDQDMSEIRGSEIKIILAICRKTYGYKKLIDQIALSQFVKMTGLKKTTVIDAIRDLVEKKIISKKTHITPFQYSINLSRAIESTTQENANPGIPDGSINKPTGVQKVNLSEVQKMNPQEKASKENKRNTTSSDLTEEVIHITKYWKEVFDKPIDLSDDYMVNQIEDRLDHFGIGDLKKAIFNRSLASYYRE